MNLHVGHQLSGSGKKKNHVLFYFKTIFVDLHVNTQSLRNDEKVKHGFGELQIIQQSIR